MSANKDYFYGRTEPIVPAINYRPWWLDALFTIGSLATAILIIVVFAGCATATRDAEVCYIKPLGNTDQALLVALQQCMTPEAFQESQK